MELVDLPNIRGEYNQMWEAIKSRPFQSVGAAFAARNGSCLIADQPGLGKTIQSIAAVIEAGIRGPILVVAPKGAAQLTPATGSSRSWVLMIRYPSIRQLSRNPLAKREVLFAYRVNTKVVIGR